MSKDKSVNLVIVDDSFNNEEKLASLIRGLGTAAHTKRVEDDEDLEEVLKKFKPDLLVYKAGMELIDLPGVVKIMKDHDLISHMSVLVLVEDGKEVDIDALMEQGANDQIDMSNEGHLKNVLRRELKIVFALKRLFSLEQAYAESEKRCASLMDTSRDAIAYIHEGMHIYSNQSYLELFGFEESEELEGMPILDMVGSADQNDFKKFLRDYAKKEGKAAFESSLKSADGTEFNGKIEFSPASIEGEPCVQIIIRNELDQKELEKQINLLSQRDQVTGLFNRQYFMDALENAVAESKKSGTENALLYLSLDNFSDLKGKLGVIGSDQLLIDIANELKKTCDDKSQILSRFDGHNFTIINLGSDRKKTENSANKIRETIENFVTEVNNISTTTTCSIGISLIDKSAPESADILMRAEKAAMESQAAAPNQISIYTPKEGELTQKEADQKVQTEIMQAMKNSMFLQYYQPIISLHGDTEERYQAYIRMKDKQGNIILPAEFLPAAERSGMMTTLDRWVIGQSIHTLAKLHKTGRNTKFFVKLSESALTDPKLLGWVEEQINSVKLTPNSLVFEVKESVAVTNLKHVKNLAEGLQALDCSFALDDFGTGMNPFQLLKHIPADYLKIESSFMENLSSNTQNQETVKNITETATKMNKLTIAQCIHDASSLSVLWGMGVNFIQGNFLQEPTAELNYDFTEMAG